MAKEWGQQNWELGTWVDRRSQVILGWCGYRGAKSAHQEREGTTGDEEEGEVLIKTLFKKTNAWQVFF